MTLEDIFRKEKKEKKRKKERKKRVKGTSLFGS